MVAFNDRTLSRCWPESLSRAGKLTSFWREDARNRQDRQKRHPHQGALKAAHTKRRQLFPVQTNGKGIRRQLGTLRADHEPRQARKQCSVYLWDLAVA